MADYTQRGHKLLVSGKLDQEDGNSFYEQCQELVERDAKTLTIDLSGVTYIGSMATGCLLYTSDAADE